MKLQRFCRIACAAMMATKGLCMLHRTAQGNRFQLRLSMS